jgi:hypothetical protein
MRADEKSENTVRLTREEAEAAVKEWATPENLARLDAMTDEDIDAQIAANPDAAPELTDEWFENARLVTPSRARSARRDQVSERLSAGFEKHIFSPEFNCHTFR